MPGAAIQDFWLNGWGPIAPPAQPTQAETPPDDGLIVRKRLIELSCRLTGSVKQKSSVSLTLHGSAKAQTMLESELSGRVKQEVKSVATLVGSCLRRERRFDWEN